MFWSGNERFNVSIHTLLWVWNFLSFAFQNPTNITVLHHFFLMFFIWANNLCILQSIDIIFHSYLLQAFMWGETFHFPSRAPLLFIYFFWHTFYVTSKQRKTRLNNSYLFHLYKLYSVHFWCPFSLESKSFYKKVILKFQKTSFFEIFKSKLWEFLSE